MKYRAFTHLLLALGASLYLAACDGHAEDQKGGGAPMGGGMPAPKVTVEKPVVQDISNFKDFTGRFEASESVEIRARVGGYLMQAPFQEGAVVQKGDKLFVIDPRPYQAALQKADADVKVAQSGIAYKQGNYERAQALFETGDISAQIRDQRLQEKDQAVAELNRAKAAYEQARLD
ncbi:MAG: biotin/lipoyl-binding protein, partial [Alphaproteobacteria bacterium]|nr:biotin/lipoyl-binding protein [Alphaproteobacteria bacterium]